MTRVDGLRMAIQRWMLVTIFGAPTLAFTMSCGGGETAAAGVRGDLTREAESNYTYGVERKPLPVDTLIISGPGGNLPTITISTASQKNGSGRVPENKFIYRLHSDAAYPAMGLAPGDNYIWRDTTSGSEGPYRTLVVPKDTAYAMTWLKRDTSVTSYAPLPATEPRLVQSLMGYGACDNNCTPHCATREILRGYGANDIIRISLRP